LLQRTPEELEIPSMSPATGKWIEATTLGYTHTVARYDGANLGLGVSVTKTLMPGDYVGAYGGDPWSGKVFVRLGGMKMWGM
jgi:hypothetical protein